MSILLKPKGRSADKNFDIEKWSFVLKFAALPLGIVIFLIAMELKPWWDRLWSPCAGLLSDEDVAAISGKPSKDARAYGSSWTCTVYYDSLTVEYQKQLGSDDMFGYRKRAEELRSKLGHKKVEEVPELVGAGGRVAGAGAVMGMERDETGVVYTLTLLIEQARNGFIKIDARYADPPTDEQRRALIETVKKKLSISTDYFVTDE